MNISNTTLSQYENSNRVPSDGIKMKIANYFQVSVDYLLGNTDNPDPSLLSEKQLPKELQGIGIEYIKLARELQEDDFSPEDIRMIIKAMKVANKSKK